MISYGDADWAYEKILPNGEEANVVSISVDGLNDDYTVFIYYETKDQAVQAAQKEIIDRIRHLQTFVL